MTFAVGVIGVGLIGPDHIRRLSRVLSGVDVVAVGDVDRSRARPAADDLRRAHAHTSMRGAGRETGSGRDVRVERGTGR